MISIVMTTVASYLIFTVATTSRLEFAVSGRMEQERLRQLEHFNVTAQTGGGKVGAKVHNFGPIPIQFSYVVVIIQANGTVAGVNNTLSSKVVSVNPGQTSSFIASTASFANKTVYRVKVVTTRGNVESDSYPRPGAGGPFLTYQNIGILSLEFKAIRWTHRTGGGPWQGDGGANWTQGWVVPAGGDLMWRINVSNKDKTRTMNITKESLVFFVTPSESATQAFWIAKVTMDGVADPYTTLKDNRLTGVQAYTDIGVLQLAPGEWKWFYFTAVSMGSATPAGLTSGSAGRQFTNFILLYGWLGVPSNWAPYGQNLPFVGVRAI